MRRSLRSVTLIFAILLFASVALMGCEDGGKSGGGKDKKAEKSQAKSGDGVRKFLLTKPGMKWEYKLTITGGGNDISQAQIIENLPQTKLDGKTVEAQKVSTPGKPEQDLTAFMTIGDTSAESAGVQLAGQEARPLGEGEKQILLKEPIKVGETWTNMVAGANGTPTPSKVEIVGVNETIKVPAGTYKNCLKLKQTDTFDVGGTKGTAETFTWMAPGVGPVKMESTVRSGGKVLQTLMTELVKFTP